MTALPFVRARRARSATHRRVRAAAVAHGGPPAAAPLCPAYPVLGDHPHRWAVVCLAAPPPLPTFPTLGGDILELWKTGTWRQEKVAGKKLLLSIYLLSPRLRRLAF